MSACILRSVIFSTPVSATSSTPKRQRSSTPENRKPGENEKAVYLTASDIVARFGSQVRLSPVQVGKALQDMGFEKYRTREGRFWKLYERPTSDIGNVLPDDVDILKDDMPF